MDEFGVLTERFGLKPQGKAAPMATSKLPTSSSTAQSRSFSFDSGKDSKPPFFSSISSHHSSTTTRDSGGFDDYSDLLFERPKNSTKQSDNLFDFDSIFSNGTSQKSSSSTSYDDEDIFGGNNDDMFESFASPPKQSSPVDDLLGGVEARLNSSSRNR